MSTTLITSDHEKGQHYIALCRAAYNKARLNDDRAQLLNERGGELQAGLRKLIDELSRSNQFASEEVASTCGYPGEYKGLKPAAKQVEIIAKILLLSPDRALEFVEKTLPTLERPDGAEGWGAFPTVDAVARRHFPEITDQGERYCRAVNLILEAIGTSRQFTNHREGQILPDRYRMHARTAHMLALIGVEQPGDIHIIPFQFGKRHGSPVARSVRRAREVFTASEFGLGGFHGGSQLLIHPERLVRWEQLHMDLPGDEFAPDADGEFSKAPCLYFNVGVVGFHTVRVSGPDKSFGSSSAFLPQ